MENARDNVNRRLGSQSERRMSTSDDSKPPDDDVQKATKATTLFPPADNEYYNLRRKHDLDCTFQERWNEAQKARYIRTREPRECERELSLNEIFEKDKK